MQPQCIGRADGLRSPRRHSARGLCCGDVLRKCALGFATQVMCAKLRVSAQVSFEEIGKATPGFVGADLSALVKEAAIAAVREYFEYSLVRAPPVPVSHLVCSSLRPYRRLTGRD